MTNRRILRANGKDWLGCKSLSNEQSIGQSAHSLPITSSDHLKEALRRCNVRGSNAVLRAVNLPNALLSKSSGGD